MATTAADAKQGSRPRLKDIPGNYGWPIIGHTFRSLRDMHGMARENYAKYGPIYRSSSLFQKQVILLGPEGNEFFFMDRGHNLSSEGGWNRYLAKLFPRGLMLLDFDEHRAHRRIMQVAFKTPAMKRYAQRLNAIVPDRIDDWAGHGRFQFYPAIKRLTLDTAADLFLGVEPSPEVERVNRALSDMVAASVAVIRAPLPGTLFRRGVKGREFMQRYFEAEIPKRRAAGLNEGGDDVLTLLCHATDEDSNRFTDQQIIDHMNFLWMAAHDTITSSVTTLVYELARHPEWQDRLRAECNGLGLNEPALPYDRLGDLTLVEYAFKEALRINAPVPAISRETVRDVEFAGHVIPKGTAVSVNTVFTHHMEEIWPEPAKFDPMRFSEEGGAKDRHKFAWVPFGGGAHMCLGLHFAYMSAKVILYHLLTRYRITTEPGYATEFQIMPLTKPKDGLPVRLETL